MAYSEYMNYIMRKSLNLFLQELLFGTGKLNTGSISRVRLQETKASASGNYNGSLPFMRLQFNPGKQIFKLFVIYLKEKSILCLNCAI